MDRLIRHVRCQHCGHPTDTHRSWGGVSDTRDVLGNVTTFCHDCAHPVCSHAVELVTDDMAGVTA